MIKIHKKLNNIEDILKDYDKRTINDFFNKKV